MSCMGPDVNEDEVQRAYQDIMALLAEKYKVQSHGYNVWTCGFMAGNFDRMREQVNIKFKGALRELFFQQAYEDF